MPLSFGTPTYKPTIRMVDYFGNVSTHTVELVASSPTEAVANGQRLCDKFNAVTGALVTGLTVKGYVPITGDAVASYGDFREYQAWISANLVDGRNTTFKIPGPEPFLLINSDKRFINVCNMWLSPFLAKFHAPGNVGTLRGSTIATTTTAIIRHVDSTKGKTIKIG